MYMYMYMYTCTYVWVTLFVCDQTTIHKINRRQVLITVSIKKNQHAISTYMYLQRGGVNMFDGWMQYDVELHLIIKAQTRQRALRTLY